MLVPVSIAKCWYRENTTADAFQTLECCGASYVCTGYSEIHVYNQMLELLHTTSEVRLQLLPCDNILVKLLMENDTLSQLACNYSKNELH